MDRDKNEIGGTTGAEEITLSALKAIVARIDGVYDDPFLVAFGPLSVNRIQDIKEIAHRAIEQAAEEASSGQ